MYSTFLSVALFSALAIQGALAEFTIETPEITQCQDVKISWQDTGAKSYNLAVVPTENPCDDILADLGDHSVNHITWKANVPAGTKVMLSVLDSNDEEAWSGSITVKDGGDSSCLPKAATTESQSSTSSSSASIATAATDNTSGTTLVVNPAAGPSSAVSAPAAPSSTDGAVAVGAANSGILGGSNGAASVGFSMSSVALGAIVAIAALSF